MTLMSEKRDYKAISRTKTQESETCDAGIKIQRTQVYHSKYSVSNISNSSNINIPKLDMPKLLSSIRPSKNSFSILFKDNRNPNNVKKSMRLSLLSRNNENSSYRSERDKSTENLPDSARDSSRKSNRENKQSKQSSTVKIKKNPLYTSLNQDSSIDMLSDVNEHVIGTNRMNNVHKSPIRTTMLDLRKMNSNNDSSPQIQNSGDSVCGRSVTARAINSVKQKFSVKCLRSVPCLCYHAETTPEDTESLILFFHANGEDLVDISKLCQKLADYMNCYVVAMEYPGYSMYQGSPSENQILEDAEAVMNFVVEELKIVTQKVFVVGRSIGSGPGIHIASMYNLGGLVLISAFSSIRNVVSDKFGSMISKLIKERFNNLQKIEKINCSIEIVHGEIDKLVPASHANSLAGIYFMI